MKENRKDQESLQQASQEWGEIPADHYGYASDSERLEKRGLDDIDMPKHK